MASSSTAAARRAGFSERRAAQTAYELLRKPVIKAAIKNGQAKLAEICEIAASKVVDELAKLAFANIANFIKIDANGKPYTDFSTATHEQLAAVAELVVETTPARVGGDGVERPEVTKVHLKLADKRAPLVDLGRHLGLFQEWQAKNEPPDGPGSQESARDIIARRLDSIAARRGTQDNPGVPDGSAG